MRSFYTLLYTAVIATASTVHNLTAGNFEAFVTGNELSLVSFFAPWCIHCHELAPEFESAAVKLQNEGWPLAQVDCEAEKQLCKDYQVMIYPTIHVFHGKDHSTYNGYRKADAMVSFMQRHSQPIVSTLSLPHEVAEFSSKDKVTVIGYFDEDDHVSRTTFTDVAKTYRDKYLFGSISHEAFGRAVNIKKPSIVLYKKFDEGKNLYTGDFGAEEIEDFLAETASPLIREIGVDLNALPSNYAGQPMAIIFAEEQKEREQLIAELRPVAEASKGQIIWVTADPGEHAKRASQVALKPGTWPAFAIEDGKNDFKFAFPKRGSIKDLNKNAIQNVIDDFLAGRLESTVRSDPVPPTQDGPVISVVADSYKEIIIDNEKDVLVLYYSPTCKHCKAMAPTYDELGDLLKTHGDQLTIAKIDATNNDVRPSVKSYPTLKLFKSGAKNEPITYKGNRTVSDFVNFVKDNGSQGIANILENISENLASKSMHDEL